MYSDMPMEELPLDPSFPKKWMHGMELVLKKGLRIQQIHNLNRPFHEVLLGLESWIPLYMTGQITSYYLKEPQNTAFSHLLRVSGSTILVGYSITGYHADGTYYLTSSRKEVDCYRKQAKDLLSHAFPLVETYRSSRKEAFQAFLEKSAQQKGDRKNLLTTLPLYTLHEDTLLSILHEAGIPSSVQKEILQYYHAKRERVETILKQGTLTDEVPFPSEAEFSSSPLYLELSGIFSDRNIEYSYALYQRHYAETEEFAENHPNYTLLKEEFRAFRNIQLCLLKDRWAMVSKANSPAIHFIVRHPVLLHALENFAPPYTE